MQRLHCPIRETEPVSGTFGYGIGTICKKMLIQNLSTRIRINRHPPVGGFCIAETDSRQAIAYLQGTSPDPK